MLLHYDDICEMIVIYTVSLLIMGEEKGIVKREGILHSVQNGLIVTLWTHSIARVFL